MVQVPLSESNRVQTRPETRERFQYQAPRNMVGPAIQQLGDALQGVSAEVQEAELYHDNAATKEAANTVAQHYAEIGYTGDNAYFSKQGRDALELRPTVEKSLDSLIQQTREGLSTTRQREMFDQAVLPQRTQWGVQIAQHAEKETRTYDLQESTARVGVTKELATASYLDDPNHGEEQISTGLSEIDNIARLQGWGDDKKALEKLKFTSGIYRDIGTSVAYKGADGPKVAEALIEKHGASMTDDDRRAVTDHARVAQNALEAEQRRLEREQHQADREAKTDAKDRANSVLRMVSDGAVVDPKTLASAMEDARKAEDPALEESLRQGGLKNNLTQQWADATPAELQNRVNELSAEITKAGGKVKPDVIVERDHLQTLLSKNRSALNQDPLSWGAEHLGIALKPLNLADPNSVHDRVAAATLIAKRTGTIPRPLMQDEVAQSQQVLTHGTVEQKVGLAMRLSQLGPLALPAAEQLTSNPAYINIIGLATHSNRGVAASRVNQIMTGYDVLKTKPKLVDKDAAQQAFNEYTGSALQFLPQVKTGVLSNAQALLASQANEHGWNEWRDVDNRAWFRAVNSALGAYTRDGKQIGGLATINGAVTVLPENMSQDEFEERISKATAPDFKRAHNGTPVYADGRTPSATDIKRMQWIPSGDGVYRLTDGHGFLHTKEGDFYEIDANRLNFAHQLAAHGYVRR